MIYNSYHSFQLHALGYERTSGLFHYNRVGLSKWFLLHLAAQLHLSAMFASSDVSFQVSLSLLVLSVLAISSIHPYASLGFPSWTLPKHCRIIGGNHCTYQFLRHRLCTYSHWIEVLVSLASQNHCFWSESNLLMVTLLEIFGCNI